MLTIVIVAVGQTVLAVVTFAIVTTAFTFKNRKLHMTSFARHCIYPRIKCSYDSILFFSLIYKFSFWFFGTKSMNHFLLFLGNSICPIINRHSHQLDKFVASKAYSRRELFIRAQFYLLLLITLIILNNLLILIFLLYLISQLVYFTRNETQKVCIFLQIGDFFHFAFFTVIVIIDITKCYSFSE